MTVSLNAKGVTHANNLISSGSIDFDSDWSFSGADGDALLGSDGSDWSNYADWFLGENTGETANTKARFEYPFGKGGKIYASAIRAIRSRAAANSADAVYASAGHLLDVIDAKKPKSLKGVHGMERAYSAFQIKAVDKAQRVIVGIATTPTPDRMGDIVESQGAVFKLPIPLLWQHDSDQPIGNVVDAKVSPEGIEVTCQFVFNTGQPTLDDRLDQCFAMVENKLVRGLSIGFMPVETAYIEGSYACRFTKWEWLELSAVTIPANSEAGINQIRSIDRKQRAAIGKSVVPVVRLSAGVAAKPASAPAPVILSGDSAMNIAERIAQLQATRAAKASAATAIMEKSVTEGRTLDAQEQNQFDDISAEVDALDADLNRFRALERMSATTATPVARVGGGTVETIEDGTAARASVPATVKTIETLDKGVRFARVAKCMAVSKLNLQNGIVTHAADLARKMYPNDEAVYRVVKAAVDAATEGGQSWASALVGAESTVFADFAEFLRPQTIVGRFGQGGIPALRTVPFRVRLLGQSSGASSGWVGEAKPAGLTRFDVTHTTLVPLKVATIAAVSMELVRDSSPAADTLIRDELARACAERLDRDFIDPHKVAVANVSPASITNGATPLVATGPDANSIRQDVGSITDAFISANLPLSSAVWVMPARIANKLALMRNALGQVEFPGISAMGGTFEGFPVITSEYVLTDSNGSWVFMVSAQDVYFADDGDTQVDLSSEAALEMSDAPAQDAGAGSGASMVSMFQTNSVAFRATRTINWALRRTQAVQAINDVIWGNVSS